MRTWILSEVEFDWDEADIGHLDRHRIRPEEAEQVILSDPADIGMKIVEGEERYVNIGATAQGRVLVVVTTWREHRVRVVTAFEPIKRLIHFYYQYRER
ncbi:MAG TPA: BrnT family toxin [Bryobacteraceae bacterium]|nr:BrnT family toxin [Bryobacteraceae bacterium]